MPSRKRCQFVTQDADCSHAAVRCHLAAIRMVGICTHCKDDFCHEHRLPEHHLCPNLAVCRQELFERNKAKLESERTDNRKVAVV